MSRLTGSKLDLAFECLHSFTLDLPPDPSGPAAQLGTEFHSAALGTGRRNPLDADGEAALADMIPTWERNGKKLLPFSRRVEVAYAITPEGAVKELGENIERRYNQHGAGPHDICLSLDVVSDERIVDLKTGKKKIPAAEAWQLRAGVAAALPHGGAAEFHYVASNGRTTVDSATFTADDSWHFRGALADLARRLRDGDTAPNPGEHCTELWCPARQVCASYQRAIGRGLPTQIQPTPKPKEESQTMSKMSLGNVTRGRVQKPYRILIYGVEGVGKSSFAAGAPGAIFVSSEDGTSHLDVARFPEVDNWEDTFAAVESLSGQHDYQTVAFDTVDWLEPLCIAHVLHVNGWSTIEKLARGEGYNAVKEEWRRLLGALEKLQTERRMNVIMIGHAKIRKHKHPELDEFDRFELSIMPGSAKLMREWAEHVLFADYETLTYKENDDKRVRTIGEGARYIHTSWRPAYDAKSRGNEAPLPEKIPLSWADFDSAVKASGNPDAVRTEIVSLLASADDDLRKKVEETMKGADPARLAQILNRLKAKLAA